MYLGFNISEDFHPVVAQSNRNKMRLLSVESLVENLHSALVTRLESEASNTHSVTDEHFLRLTDNVCNHLESLLQANIQSISTASQDVKFVYWFTKLAQPILTSIPTYETVTALLIAIDKLSRTLNQYFTG